MFPKGGMGNLMKQAKEMQSKMAKAQEELDKDKPDKAIDRFKKVWEHAVKAAREAGKGI